MKNSKRNLAKLLSLALAAALLAGLLLVTASAAETVSPRDAESTLPVFDQNQVMASAANESVMNCTTGVIQVNVIYTDPNSKTSTKVGYGSGFLINKTTVVTNDHVVHPAEDDEAVRSFRTRRGVSQQDFLDRLSYSVTVSRDVTIPVTINQSSSQMDFAILTLAQPLETRTILAIRSSAEVQQTETVYALGFPGSDADVQDVSFFNSSDVNISGGSVNKVAYGVNFFTLSDNYTYIQSNVVINSGNSGGPLVDADGNVVGIVEGSYDGYCYAVAIDQVTGICDDLGIAYHSRAAAPSEPAETESPTHPSEPEPKPEPGSNVLLYLMIGAAAVAGFLFYRKKSGKKPQQSHEGSVVLESGGTNAGGAGSDNSADKTSPQPDGQDIYGPTVPNPSTAHSLPLSTAPVQGHGTVPLAQWQLRGVEGPLRGKVYPLSGKVTVGRSAQCDVRFSQDAPGISGTHCQVRVKDGQVYIQDLGSSYGTFYPQNNRLNPKTDYLLHEGGVFNLAQGGGAFRLEKAGAADTGRIVIKDMNGKTYKSDASMKITLGRNPGCQGGFGSGESSVSGRHCELYREGGKLYLMDLGSTNGTFFSQNERLRPNEPYRIRKGMAFFLTTPKYTFVVAEE